MRSPVLLKPFDRELIETYRKWVNDPAVSSGISRTLPVTAAEHEKWYADLIANRNAVVFAIMLPTKEYIGNVWLWNIDWIHRKAEVRILIGEQHQGKGYGTAALRGILDFACDKLNLNRVYSYVLVDNEPSVKAFKRAAFEVEGTLRRDRFVDGAYRDVLVMSALRRQTD